MIIARKFLTALSLLLISCAYAQAAETVHLYLKSNGEDIVGETTTTNTQSFRERIAEHLKHKNRDKGSGNAAGRRTYEPIVVRKRIDKSSPMTAPEKTVKAPQKGAAMATGRRTYEPIVIRKQIDKSSPLFEKAAKHKTPLGPVIIKQRGDDGKTYKIELQRVYVKSYQLGVSDNDATVELKFSGLKVLD